MGKAKHGILIALEKNVEFLAGETISKKVMEDGEEITERTDKRKIAEWVKDDSKSSAAFMLAFINPLSLFNRKMQETQNGVTH